MLDHWESKIGKTLDVWYDGHTLDGMKMTMHIEEDLLGRVMKHLGVESKTRAVELALREVDRKAELVRLCNEGLGLTAEELRETFRPEYDPELVSMNERPEPARSVKPSEARKSVSGLRGAASSGPKGRFLVRSSGSTKRESGT